MAETWHEYEFPNDATMHLEKLRKELREGALTTSDTRLVTCPGCRAWIKRMAAAS